MLALDAHVHLYPVYPLSETLTAALARLRQAAPPGAQCLLALAERADCRYFSEIADGARTRELGAIAVHATADPDALRLDIPELGELFLIAGRQIVTSERLELLALGRSAAVPDGLPFAAAHGRVLAAGAAPVLNWAPGKWMLARRRAVTDIISRAAPPELLLGDTTLRPIGWGLPALMRLGQERGLKIVRGSDPLPLPGEHRRIGSYGLLADADCSREHPARSLRQILLESTTVLQPLGRRGYPVETALRLLRNELQRRGIVRAATSDAPA